MAAHAPRRTTLDEYFAVEAASEVRHEFLGEQIYVMSGGTSRHSYLGARVNRLLGNALDGGPCFVMNADQRVATPEGLHTYPDGVVFCGEIELGQHHTALNPAVLLEVMSDSTRAYDRGEKLRQYKAIPSLRHVVFVEPDALDIEVWSRAGDSWTRRVYVERTDEVALPGVGVTLVAGDVYEGVDRLP